MKKGFTLVELMGVILILGILALILVPAMDSTIKKSKNESYNSQKESIIISLENWLSDNKDLFYENDSITLTLLDLKEQNYAEFDLINPRTGMCISNDLQLMITKSNKKYTYSIIDNELVDGPNSDCGAVNSNPTIYLSGTNPVKLEINSSYSEPGYIAKDSNGNDITEDVTITNNIDSTTLGSYNVVYNVSNNGLSRSKTRIVNVKDTLAPSLVIPEDATISTRIDSYDLLDGVSAIDNSGEEVSLITRHNLSLGVEGDYEITYIATDSSGNTTKKTRNIHIIKEYILLKSYTSGSTEDFHNDLYRTKIKELYFVNNANVPSDAITFWDLSLAGDNSIIGWIVPNQTSTSLYDLYIGSDSNIRTNPDSSYWFYNMYSLTKIEFKNYIADNLTNTSYMFSGLLSIKNIDVSNFNTSNVTNMKEMFASLNAIENLDVGNFDTSNVIDMSGMFYLNQVLKSLDLSNFDTSKVEDMSSMFAACFKLADLNISNFDTSSVTNMSSMFNNTQNIVSLDLSNFDTSNVTDMSSMFSVSLVLKNLNISNFDTSSVTDMSSMFSVCQSLTNLNIGDVDFANVTSSTSMFSNTRAIMNIVLSSNLALANNQYNFIKNLRSNTSSTMFTSSSPLFDGGYVVNGLKSSINVKESSLINNVVSDVSGNSNTATLYNISNSTIGINNPLLFNGTTSYAILQQHNYNRVTYEATVIFGTSTATQLIANNMEAGGCSLHITKDYKPACQCYSTEQAKYVSFISNTILTVGTKYHLSFTYDGTNISLYINGVKDGSLAMTGDITEPSSSTVVALGANPKGNTIPSGSTGYFKGQIYSFRIYNRALSDEEIAYNYNSDAKKFSIQ